MEKKLEHVESSGIEPEAVKKRKGDDFKAKRQAHYNEFQKMKEWKEKHGDED